MYFLVELDDGLVRTRLPEPRVRGVAHNRDQPRAGIAAAEPAGILKRSQVGFLHHVLRVFAVAHQPARQVVGGIKMRKQEFSKPASLSSDRDSLAHQHVLLRSELFGACSRLRSSSIECVRGERRGQWNRTPERMGYRSPGKYFETEGLCEILLCGFQDRAEW